MFGVIMAEAKAVGYDLDFDSRPKPMVELLGRPGLTLLKTL